MSEVVFTFAQIPAFARALKIAAPKYLVRETGRALYKIGGSDIEKLKSEQLSGQRLNIRHAGFRNSFVYKASDSRAAKSIDDLQLSEYTGAKPFRIFQEGGDIVPTSKRTLTIFIGKGRRYGKGELRQAIASGELKVIKTKSGPAVVKEEIKFTKKGTPRRGSKITIIALLRPMVHEEQRIDFYGNYDANAAEHERLLGEAADNAIEKTINEEEGEE